jgi:hypothetical protein
MAPKPRQTPNADSAQSTLYGVQEAYKIRILLKMVKLRQRNVEWKGTSGKWWMTIPKVGCLITRITTEL